MEQNGETVDMPWKDYLEKYIDESQHELIRRNVLLATRNFQHRMEVFKKEIVFGPNNPMRVRHISYRVEFQGRGAAHIHGVLWIDLKAVKVKGTSNETLQKAFQNLRHQTALSEDEAKAMENFTDEFVTCSLCTCVVGEEAAAKAENFNWHSHSQTCKKRSKLCRFGFPRYPLARTIFIDANKKIPQDEKMDKKTRKEILQRVRTVLTEEKDGKIVVSKAVQDIMQGYDNVQDRQGCEYLKDTGSNKVSTTNYMKDQESNVITSENVEEEEASEGSQPHFKDLEGNKVLQYKQSQKPKGVKFPYVKRESPEEYEVNIKARIEKVLEIASAGGTPITYEQYEKAVCQEPRKGSTTLLRRDIDEIFVNNYNPEWIVAWD